QTTSQGSKELKRHLGRYLHQSIRGDDRVGGKRGLAKEMAVEGLAIAGIGGCARLLTLESASRYECISGPEAITRLSVKTVAAGSAGRPANDDLVARRNFCDTRANMFDHARAFMTEHGRERHGH